MAGTDAVTAYAPVGDLNIYYEIPGAGTPLVLPDRPRRLRRRPARARRRALPAARRRVMGDLAGSLESQLAVLPATSHFVPSRQRRLTARTGCSR
jgi:hypothetical protein